MKDNMRFMANGLPSLNLLGLDKYANACKGFSKMWFVVMLLVVLAGCNGTNSSLGGGGTTGPAVTSTVPTAGAQGVAIDTTVSATFTTAMDPATITTTTFTVATGGSNIGGTVALSADGLTATFTPSTNLTADTLYTATITTGAKDTNGNALAANKVWTFTTGTGVAPTVTSFTPPDGAVNQVATVVISATFSAAMDPLTINTTTFTMTNATTSQAVPGAVTLSADHLTATFTPTGGALAASSSFIARITTGVRDESGNAMASPVVWSFTTL